MIDDTVRVRPNKGRSRAGPVRFERPYYVCGQCSHAPNPVDAALGVENQEFSPGVRRMTAVAGSDLNFDLAREQIELLAGIKLSTKSVERHAEQIEAQIRRIEQAGINRSVQVYRKDALSHVSRAGSVHRLRRHRSWLQVTHRRPAQAIWHVLDRGRRQPNHRPSLLPPQRKV